MKPGNNYTVLHLSARHDSSYLVVIQLTLPSELKNQAVTPCGEKF